MGNYKVYLLDFTGSSEVKDELKQRKIDFSSSTQDADRVVVVLPNFDWTGDIDSGYIPRDLRGEILLAYKSRLSGELKFFLSHVSYEDNDEFYIKGIQKSSEKADEILYQCKNPLIYARDKEDFIVSESIFKANNNNILLMM
jgi:hypothetical protein